MIAARLAGCALVLLGAACGGPGGPRPEPASEPAEGPAARIASAEATLERHPNLYPVWAELGEAYLDGARVSRDPVLVRRALEAFERSLGIQPNFVAQRGMTALANFRHRFEEALAWAARARETHPPDTSVLAMQVEALLSLGRVDEAQAVLDAHGSAAGDFHALSARARVLVARGEPMPAARTYEDAADLAREQAPALAQWALVRAAAAFLDSGAPAAAEPLLAQALAIDPGSVDAQVHMAEAEEARGDARAAYERCAAILRAAEDPTVHAAAARLARSLGDDAAARRHFEAANRAFTRVLDAGEVYALGAQAALLCDAAARLDEALDLALRHRAHLPVPVSDALVARIEALTEASAR